LTGGVGWKICPYFGIGGRHGNPASGGAHDEALHDEKGFVDFLEGGGVFANRDGEGGKSDGASREFVDHDLEDALVHFVEAVFVDLDHFEGGLGGGSGDGAIGSDLNVVADPAEEVVGDAGGAPGAGGYDRSALSLDLEFEDLGGALDNDGKLFVGVVVEPIDEAEAGAEGGGEHAGAGGGADEGEFRKLELDGAGGGAGVDDDIEPEVFHGGVEVFLDGGVEAVNFVDEEDVAALEVGEDSGEVARFLDLGAGGGVQGGADGAGDDVGESSFTQPGRAREEDMFKNVIAAFGRGDHEHEALGNFFLAVEVLESGRAEGEVFERRGGINSFLKKGLRHANLGCPE
jgi:hypothetical protein